MKNKKLKWNNTMEFQVKNTNNQWFFCSYSTFLRRRAKGEEVRSRKAGTGYWKLEF